MKTYTCVDYPGKIFRRLETGEAIEATDFLNSKGNQEESGWISAEILAQSVVNDEFLLHVYREVTDEKTQFEKLRTALQETIDNPAICTYETLIDKLKQLI
jgi:hypothetical protein